MAVEREVEALSFVSDQKKQNSFINCDKFVVLHFRGELSGSKHAHGSTAAMASRLG